MTLPARSIDAAGRPLCFTCNRPQSEHPGGIECVPAKPNTDELGDLVRRAAPFVNAVAVMAEDKSQALAWLADAAIVIGQRQ